MKRYLPWDMVLFSVLLSMGINAQENIPLSNEEISRFGIEFSAVQPIDGNSGMQVPATVINSPLSASDITARFEGVLDSWDVKPGDEVEANQVIGVLNSQEVLGIQQEWIMADADLMEAEFNLEKDEMLFEEGVISRQRLVQTRRNYQQASINSQAARQRLQMAGFDDEQIQAVLDSGEGLGVYFIRSPVAGSISRLAVNAGNYVAANSTLVSFSSGNLWVRAQLPARLWQQLKADQQVKLAGSGQTLFLRLQDFAADEDSQMIDLYAEFGDPVSLLPGQIVSLVLTPEGGGVLMPESAVVHSGDETIVFVRRPAGVEARKLSLIPVGEAYLALDGISEGDEVVTRGTAQLKGIQLGLGSE